MKAITDTHVPSVRSGWYAPTKEVEKKRAWLLDPAFIRWALLVVLVLRGLIFAFVVPPWQHPDEPTHFEHIRLIAERGELPAPDTVDLPLRLEIAESMAKHGFWDPDPPPSFDHELMANPGLSTIGIYTLTHPRLYYILSAIWLKPWLGLDVESQLYIVRMLSVILNFFIVLVVYQMVKVLYPASKWLAVFVAAFVTFLPTFTDMMSAVNNDVLVNLFGAIFFLIMATIFKRGLTILRVTLLMVVLLLAFFTKTTALVLVSTLPVALLLYIWRSGHHLWFLGILVAVLLVVAASLILWQLDILQGWINVVGDWMGEYLRVSFSGTFARLEDPEYRSLPLHAAPHVFRTFWGVFGWGHIPIASAGYIAWGGITMLASLGLIYIGLRWLVKVEKRSSYQEASSFLTFAVIASILAWTIAIFRSVAYQGLSIYISHGRYIFVAIAPFVLALTMGMRVWIKERWHSIAGLLFIFCLALYDLYCFLGTVVPFYY